MLEKKTQEFLSPKATMKERGFGRRAWMGMLALALAAGSAAAQNAQIRNTAPGAAPTARRIGGIAPVTYDNKYEIYGGLGFMNFQAGQALTSRMNLGGAEVLGTYWLTPKWGLGAEWRGMWGTTPVNPNPYIGGRPLVALNMGMAGAQYRGPKNQYAALNFHAYGGAAHGNFNHSTGVVPPQALPTIGLYSDRTKPVFALGASVDINHSKNLAFRVSPDLILEHFGDETRTFFGVSGGVVYRFGQRGVSKK
ncbi:MAG TPA: hypothetical protein VGB69_11850 [Edaphobacter sp.]